MNPMVACNTLVMLSLVRPLPQARNLAARAETASLSRPGAARPEPEAEIALEEVERWDGLS